MSGNLFSRRLREFAHDAITSPGEHQRHEIAEAFIAEHPELVETAVRELAERQINSVIKALCDADADAAQSDLFGGLPVAISFGDGRVKAIEHCTLADLEVGRANRMDNVAHARRRLRQYDEAVQRIAALARTPDETVGDIAARVVQRRSA